MNASSPSDSPMRQNGSVTPVEQPVENRPDLYRGPQGYPSYPQFEVVQEDGGIDFYRYLRVLSKYRWMILGSVAAATALAVTITFLMAPIYRATTALQIDREAMQVVKVDNLQPDEAQSNSAEFYQTQYELLASRSLAERVVSAAGLINDPIFNSTKQTLWSTISSFVTGSYTAPKLAPGATSEDKLRAVTDKLQKSLTVAPVRGSKIVKVSIDSSDPALAQRIANVYAQTYIADNLDRRFDATSYARKFLEDRLQQLKVKLEDSEKQLVKYAQDQGIINTNDNKNLTAADLEATNQKLSEARADRIKKELLWKQAQATNGLGLKEILDNPAIQENMKQKAQLEGDYQLKLATFKPAYPAMVELRNKINELNRQIQAAADSIKQSIHASYVASKEEEDRLQSMLDTNKAAVSDLRGRNIQYTILQREVDTNRTLYEGLLQRYKEIGVAGGVGTNNISVVDQASLPRTPRSPVLWLNALVASLAGLILGALVALGLDYLDDSFKAPEDVERELGVTVLGVIPKPDAGASVDDELNEPRSSISEAYRSLRTGLQFATSEGLPRSLLVTSSRPSEGKTTTALHLAQTLSHMGVRVLLIDSDLRKASLHKRINVSNEVGLSNYLTGAKSPEEVVRATDNDKLVIMTSGPLPPNPAELLAGPKFPSLLALATESFDTVIVDGPPVMGLADAPLISNFVQTTVLVVAANDTRRNVVRIALRRLLQARANLIGVILNKFDFKATGYGYGYGYGETDYYSYASDTQALPRNGT